mmetsp:Transcript_31033/g.94979  ORF Transcript_31033/g.94979 Transcript_31033/m.94979 type:complete len:203 (+) Transcript_31033:306-914(+)
MPHTEVPAPPTAFTELVCKREMTPAMHARLSMKAHHALNRHRYHVRALRPSLHGVGEEGEDGAERGALLEHSRSGLVGELGGRRPHAIPAFCRTEPSEKEVVIGIEDASQRTVDPAVGREEEVAGDLGRAQAREEETSVVEAKDGDEDEAGGDGGHRDARASVPWADWPAVHAVRNGLPGEAVPRHDDGDHPQVEHRHLDLN